MQKRKRGGQPGNKNAVGHGAPVGNKNAEKFGFHSRFLIPTPFDEAVVDYILDSGQKLTLDRFLKTRSEILSEYFRAF